MWSINIVRLLFCAVVWGRSTGHDTVVEVRSKTQYQIVINLPEVTSSSRYVVPAADGVSAIDEMFRDKNSEISAEKIPGAVTEKSSEDRPDYRCTSDVGAHCKFQTGAKPWNVARLVCGEERSDPAVINSVAEVGTVTDLCKNTGEIDGSQHPGSVALFEEGQFPTLDGRTLEKAGYDQRVFADPDNEWTEGEEEGNCGAIHEYGFLNDIGCNAPFTDCDCELRI